MALLDWLEAAFEKCEHDGGTGHSLPLLCLYDVQQFPDLIHVSTGRFKIPLWPHYRRSV
jgi:hypothetical protein